MDGLTAKRKAAEDSNPLLSTKKQKKEPSTKRKLIGEAQPGGLVIVRAPQQRSLLPPASSQPVLATVSRPLPPLRPPSSSQPLPSSSNALEHPSKKLKLDSSSRAPTGAKQRDVIAAAREEPELDEDIRQMENETDDLRRRSRAKESTNQSLQFPHSSSSVQRQQHTTDTIQPVPQCETPQIKRNKLMRDGPPQSNHHERQPSTPHSPRTPQGQQTPRRTSMSMRGKRISTSFENTGVISQPHASVSDASFYKHIDCELPEPQRARQLLVWSAARAMTRLSDPSSSSSKPPSSGPSSSKVGETRSRGKDPPPLNNDQKDILKVVQEEFIRMLAERKIDTSVYSQDKLFGAGSAHNGKGGEGKREMKPNEQNVKNREREVTFQHHIQRAEAEAEAWSRVDNFYHTYATHSKVELEARRDSFKPPLSAKARGKQRAVSQEPEQEGDGWRWMIPSEEDLSERFRSSVDLTAVGEAMTDEARYRVGSSTRGDSNQQDEAIEDLRFKLDSLSEYVHSVVQVTSIVEADLDHRFSLLSDAICARSRPVPPQQHHHPTLALAGRPKTSRSSLPHSLRHPHTVPPHPPGESSRDLLRALSRIDKERPPGKIGDAVRRAAREVQRVQEGLGISGVGERKLTDLPPPPTGVGSSNGVGVVTATPRKVPGTPRKVYGPGTPRR
ncbi:Mis12-Mtw1 protein family-domain-containing protein [Pisolithus orientalis]|uniref:Mis12-Mtw1 protein family-domain-containing protein n=1 Tax=Pisolithus orientalis TaxID=936130 RepID=UPI00222452AA|nr:Mis12-Mtw1 protein family-domain-containing protein [Pisolithus orientalis]KAI5990850.1 Mis12-Mtw1 protein family-domain-containing protein [Pisolithus orientalis]